MSSLTNGSLLFLSVLLSAGCATIVKSDKMPVQFSGGLSDGTTRINLPDGQFLAPDGKTTILVTRSKEDIPVSVTCNNITREGIIRTSYDPLAGIAGNLVFGGLIGIGIDAVGNKAYDPPQRFNIAPLCNEKTDEQMTNVPVGNSRRPSASAP